MGWEPVTGWEQAVMESVGRACPEGRLHPRSAGWLCPLAIGPPRGSRWEWGALRAAGCLVWRTGLGKDLRATEIGESVGWHQEGPVLAGFGRKPGGGDVLATE